MVSSRYGQLTLLHLRTGTIATALEYADHDDKANHDAERRQAGP